jgi:hypothetical protein
MNRNFNFLLNLKSDELHLELYYIIPYKFQQENLSNFIKRKLLKKQKVLFIECEYAHFE